jgi:hypothetical protein
MIICEKRNDDLIALAGANAPGVECSGRMYAYRSLQLAA